VDNVDIITLLLDKGMSVNVTSEWAESPLHSAARSGSLRAAEFLVRAGATIDKADGDGCTALIYAARNGEVEVVRFLVENGADVNVSSDSVGSALYQATVKGQLELMQYLLDNGADVNASTDYCDRRPLYVATENQNLETVKWLIERGADVNISKRSYDRQEPSPLHVAARCGNLEIMDCLIKAGANVNVRDSDGATPLFCAVDRGETDAAFHLVENGADVNLCIGGFKRWSPLHVAARYGNPNIMECLLKAGANVNVQDSDGATPLFWAAAKGKTEAAIHLIENGADVNLCTGGSTSESPLHVAAQYGNQEIMDFLITAGADVNVLDYDGAKHLFC
jgi:ankyrin repeat protein